MSSVYASSQKYQTRKTNTSEAEQASWQTECILSKNRLISYAPLRQKKTNKKTVPGKLTSSRQVKTRQEKTSESKELV
jgi:hypothetical protein